ncbi:endolytic transglycosylase MltG [Rickettsiales bacterium]|nr:endolytic transglycosylase MltG [Rickettsiales bacterium]
MTLEKISNLLKEEKIISSELIFKLWVKLNSLEKKLKFGEYRIPNSISVVNLTQIFVKGQSVSHLITIPEGISKYDLLQLIKKIKPNKSDNIVFTDLPDMLIANTYSYTINDSIYEIIKNIQKRSIEITEDLWNKKKQTIPIKGINELFILASIIEKETGRKSEKNKIAGVFFNRLEAKMRLQSDPTVIYGITLGKKLNRKLTRKDLKIYSKYNTYTNHGLPPSPICIPGIESLKAVLNPYSSNYYYFVSDKNGGHIFSENYNEHLKNVSLMKRKVKKEK